jgi:hypothetical protein
MTDDEIKAHSLDRTFEQVGEQIWRIDIWTESLMRFASSVPIYEPEIWFKGIGQCYKMACSKTGLGRPEQKEPSLFQ